MAPDSPACSFIHASMAGSRSTAPSSRNNFVLFIMEFLELPPVSRETKDDVSRLIPTYQSSTLNHGRRVLLLRFADQQMNMVGHHHITDNDERITLSDLLQHSEKQVAAAPRAEQGPSAIATASNEMKIAGAAVAMQVVPHGHRIAARDGRGGDGGTVQR
jgi:hypothetical protein